MTASAPTPTPSKDGSAEALLPCPFCGGAAMHNGPATRYVCGVHCQRCECELTHFDSQREADAAWNRRAAPPVLSARPNEADRGVGNAVGWTCGVCDGEGTVSTGSWDPGDQRRDCATCNGTGIVMAEKNEADAPRGQAVARPFAYYNAKYGTVFVSRAGDPPEAQSGAMESGELVPLYLAPPPSPVGEDAPALQAGGVREKYRAITFDDIRNMVDAWRQNNGTGLDSLTAAFNYAKSIGAVVPQEGK